MLATVAVLWLAPLVAVLHDSHDGRQLSASVDGSSRALQPRLSRSQDSRTISAFLSKKVLGHSDSGPEDARASELNGTIALHASADGQIENVRSRHIAAHELKRQSRLSYIFQVLPNIYHSGQNIESQLLPNQDLSGIPKDVYNGRGKIIYQCLRLAEKLAQSKSSNPKLDSLSCGLVPHFSMLQRYNLKKNIAKIFMELNVLDDQLTRWKLSLPPANMMRIEAFKSAHKTLFEEILYCRPKKPSSIVQLQQVHSAISTWRHYIKGRLNKLRLIDETLSNSHDCSLIWSTVRDLSLSKAIEVAINIFMKRQPVIEELYFKIAEYRVYHIDKLYFLNELHVLNQILSIIENVFVNAEDLQMHNLAAERNIETMSWLHSTITSTIQDNYLALSSTHYAKNASWDMHLDFILSLSVANPMTISSLIAEPVQSVPESLKACRTIELPANTLTTTSSTQMAFETLLSHKGSSDAAVTEEDPVLLSDSFMPSDIESPPNEVQHSDYSMHNNYNMANTNIGYSTLDGIKQELYREMDIYQAALSAELGVQSFDVRATAAFMHYKNYKRQRSKYLIPATKAYLSRANKALRNLKSALSNLHSSMSEPLLTDSVEPQNDYLPNTFNWLDQLSNAQCWSSPEFVEELVKHLAMLKSALEAASVVYAQ